MGFLGKWIRFSAPHKHIQTVVTVMVALTAATGIVGAIVYEPPLRAAESGAVEVVDERLCGVSDDSSLKAAAVETTDGHWSHEDWLAKESSQDEVFRIHEKLGALPALTGSGAASTPETETLASRLASGVVGVTADNVTQRFIVVVDSSVVSLDVVGEALREISSELQIEVRPSCHSIAQLAATEETLNARQWHPSATEASLGYYMDPATGSFKVTFSSSDDEVAQSLKDTLGNTVEITYGEPSRRGRLDDGNPHYGGAGIGEGADNNFCTSGFTIVHDGSRGSVTAGHCFENGESVYSGPQEYGTTAGKAFFPTYDMIRIESSTQEYDNVIHVDPCCPSVRDVTSDGDTAVNAYVCVSGMTTRAKCGVKVVSMSATLCDYQGCTGNLGFAEDENGRTISGPGDSGAPVYSRWSGNTAPIRGMLIGNSAADNFYFHKISRMESVLSMDVAHS